MAKCSPFPAFDQHPDDVTASGSAPADNTAPLPLPRAKTLRPGLDLALHLGSREREQGRLRRVAGRAVAARLWAEHTLGDQRAIGRWLGLDNSVVSRWGTEEKALVLGDVLACDPAIAARVLLAALEHVESLPLRGEGLPLSEAIRVGALIWQVVARLNNCQPELMTASARFDLVRLIDEAIEALRRLRRRVIGGGR